MYEQDTVEIVEQPTSLDERAIAAKRSEEGAKTLIEEFMPFLHGRVARYSAQYDEHVREDLLSAAMSALYEAVQCYEGDKGHFFPFAKRVVCARIIDSIRKISRHEGRTVSLSDDDDIQQSSQTAVINVISLKNYDEERRRERLVEEIEQFKTEIASWGITMESLERSSPKHKELRNTYRSIVSKVVESQDITQTISMKRYFPIKAVSKITGIPQKKLERARTFVLASLIVKTGDYELLSEYVEDRGRG